MKKSIILFTIFLFNTISVFANWQIDKIDNYYFENNIAFLYTPNGDNNARLYVSCISNKPSSLEIGLFYDIQPSFKDNDVKVMYSFDNQEYKTANADSGFGAYFLYKNNSKYIIDYKSFIESLINSKTLSIQVIDEYNKVNKVFNFNVSNFKQKVLKENLKGYYINDVVNKIYEY